VQTANQHDDHAFKHGIAIQANHAYEEVGNSGRVPRLSSAAELRRAIAKGHSIIAAGQRGKRQAQEEQLA